MFDLMYQHKGIGLAANQVDLPYRIFWQNDGERVVFNRGSRTTKHDASERFDPRIDGQGPILVHFGDDGGLSRRHVLRDLVQEIGADPDIAVIDENVGQSARGRFRSKAKRCAEKAHQARCGNGQHRPERSFSGHWPERRSSLPGP